MDRGAHQAGEAGINDDFIRDLVAKANANAERLKGCGIDLVRELVDGADVVIGVFQDQTQPYDVGTHVIKGHRLLKTVVAEHATKRARLECIPCRSLEEAVAFQHVVGEPDAMN